MHRKVTLSQRFWSYVHVPFSEDGCWIWMASLDDRGYGQSWDGKAVIKAHRLAWKLTHGEIPSGLHCLHSCDNRKCVRPDHLFLGTNGDNIADKIAKGRQSRGTQCHSAKLNDYTASMIIATLEHGGTPRWYLQRLFGSSSSTISNISTGQRWKHLPRETAGLRR